MPRFLTDGAPTLVVVDETPSAGVRAMQNSIDPSSPFACLFYTAPANLDGTSYDRQSAYADERDPNCRACQEPERYDDHTCRS